MKMSTLSQRARRIGASFNSVQRSSEIDLVRNEVASFVGAFCAKSISDHVGWRSCRRSTSIKAVEIQLSESFCHVLQPSELVAEVTHLPHAQNLVVFSECLRFSTFVVVKDHR